MNTIIRQIKNGNRGLLLPMAKSLFRPASRSNSSADGRERIRVTPTVGFRWEMQHSKLLRQITDYVDQEDVVFFHRKLDLRTRYLSDYNKCKALNKETTGDIAYFYWSRHLMDMRVDHDLMNQYLKPEYMKWDVLGSGMGETLFKWGAATGRIFAFFPELRPEQLSFAHRFYTTTFWMDEPFEYACRTGTWRGIGVAYVNNMKSILKDAKPQVQDLRKFKSDIITDQTLDSCLLAQEALMSTTLQAKRIFEANQFAYHVDVTDSWFDHLLIEAESYDANVKKSTSSTYHELLNTRYITVGFDLVTAGILPPNKLINFSIRARDTFYQLASTVVAIDNDYCSAPNESGEKREQESPSNLFFAIQRNSNLSQLMAMRELADRRNEMVMAMDLTLDQIPLANRVLFHNILKYCFAINDYEFIVDEGVPNPRYGVEW